MPPVRLQRRADRMCPARLLRGPPTPPVPTSCDGSGEVGVARLGSPTPKLRRRAGHGRRAHAPVMVDARRPAGYGARASLPSVGTTAAAAAAAAAPTTNTASRRLHCCLRFHCCWLCCCWR
jgi:hypothetical protein